MPAARPAAEALFLQPVHRHLELPDLLVELLDQVLLLPLPLAATRRSRLKDLWTRIQQLAFPLGDLDGRRDGPQIRWRARSEFSAL